ncbi:MAG: alkaline phosphatase family protein [Bernardetiaceae bacterium]|nr:alkaline phosphatase family protein [Bernardetiaceae bacterium]
MKNFFLTLCLSFCCMLTYAQSSLLESGPMVGYSDMREVAIWVKTNAPADVQIRYTDKENPKQILKSPTVRTDKDFVAHVLCDTEPGKKYEYNLYINGKEVKRDYPLTFQSQTLWQWRSDAPDFSFSFGSCAYVNEEEYDRPGKSYGGEYEIFETIRQKAPDFMIWGGDNTYLREVDWNSRSGILKRYSHTRKLPEMQALLGSVHHYAIWDDHDYGPDNSDRSYWLKDEVTEIYKKFWLNPNYGAGGGVSGTFFWNDAQFFLMDNRSFRTPGHMKASDSDKAMLGKAQVEWLIEALKYSKSTFKFIVIGSQVLNDMDCEGMPWCENYSLYAEEQRFLLEAIKKEGIEGVIFLTGDRHHTGISKLEKNMPYPIYDITISPLTSGAAGERGKQDNNSLILEETYVGVRNFGLFSITGKKGERKLSIKCYDTQGKEKWTYNITQQELAKPKK